MDEIYETQKNKSMERLDKATKHLRHVSHDANDKVSYLKKLDHAENNYDLFHKSMHDEQMEREMREKKRKQSRVKVKPQDLSKCFWKFMGVKLIWV